MTMKITITNDATNNPSYAAKVTVRDFGGDGVRQPSSETVLKPGESHEAYIHNFRDIQVEEVAVAPAADVAAEG